jgi:hypothetical protein
MMLLLIVTEIGGQKYRAELQDGTLVLEVSRQPFLDGARELLKRGYDPATPYDMKRVNSETLSFVTTTIGDAAGLTVVASDSGSSGRSKVPCLRPQNSGEGRPHKR